MLHVVYDLLSFLITAGQTFWNCLKLKLSLCYIIRGSIFDLFFVLSFIRPVFLLSKASVVRVTMVRICNDWFRRVAIRRFHLNVSHLFNNRILPILGSSLRFDCPSWLIFIVRRLCLLLGCWDFLPAWRSLWQLTMIAFLFFIMRFWITVQLSCTSPTSDLQSSVRSSLIAITFILFDCVRSLALLRDPASAPALLLAWFMWAQRRLYSVSL